MKTVLCYGDSNTWGYDPAAYDPKTGAFGRYPYQVRWPGRLAGLLGEGYQVIEEAYNGRTTVFDDPSFPGRSALNHFPVSFYSHEPLDYLTIMLGTNDMKDVFSAQACVIGWGMERLIRDISLAIPGSLSPRVKLIIISPPELLPIQSSGEFFGGFSEESRRKSRKLAAIYSDIARRYGCGFIDAAELSRASGLDGIHMEQEGHARVALALAEMIKTDNTK